MIEEVSYYPNFISNPTELYGLLKEQVNWDLRMKARKTASYGVAYNYSQIFYPFQEFIPSLSLLLPMIEDKLNFLPNNCLINFYEDGKSKMGFHSDNTDILKNGTGVAIISLGEKRTLRFKSMIDSSITKDYVLESGSLFYMSASVQKEWKHAIIKSETTNGRISLTFRDLLV